MFAHNQAQPLLKKGGEERIESSLLGAGEYILDHRVENEMEYWKTYPMVIQ